MDKKLAELQKALDEKYAEHGLTDEILKEQLMINKARHEHDIPDKTNSQYKEFVQ